MTAITTAMILAAGRGERMRPLTDSTPKPLLTVQGKPLIQHHVEALVDAGIQRIVINHAWLGQQIVDYLGDGKQFGVDIVYSDEREALETAGGIKKALPLLRQHNGTGQIAVVNGDVFTDFKFATLSLLENGDKAHLILVPNPPQHPDGDFSLENGRVGVVGTPKFTFSGLAVYALESFESLPSGKLPLAPLLREWMAENAVAGSLFSGTWHDIGTQSRLEEINRRAEEI